MNGQEKSSIVFFQVNFSANSFKYMYSTKVSRFGPETPLSTPLPLPCFSPNDPKSFQVDKKHIAGTRPVAGPIVGHLESSFSCERTMALPNGNLDAAFQRLKSILQRRETLGAFVPVGGLWSFYQLYNISSWIQLHFLRRGKLDRYKVKAKGSGPESEPWALVTGASAGIGELFAPVPSSLLLLLG
jgi:hypothetical protein